LLGFFDQDLIGSVVANIITNSIRYAQQHLLVRAWEEAGVLVLSICDDGAGYPEAMLAKQSDYALGINHSTGSTGLGLYFAGRIAALHERQGVRGHIEISNGGPLGGGEFRIYLP
jgi:signal transduction histidine kinase